MVSDLFRSRYPDFGSGFSEVSAGNEDTANDRMVTALGLLTSNEHRGPWWSKDSYVRANGIIKCLLQEYLKSGTREVICDVTKDNVELEGMEIDVDQNGEFQGGAVLRVGAV